MVENEEYAAFVRRSIRGLGRRAGGDVEALVLLAGLSDEIEAALRTAVTTLHDGEGIVGGVGFSYGEIASRLGVTRQAVQKRWGGPGAPTEGEADRGPGEPAGEGSED